MSLKKRIFPSSFKEALLRPLLKKLNLELIKKNYRPVSNLAYTGKLIERIVAKQIIKHVNQNDIIEDLQSAYREHHSTELALKILKVKTDILKSIDNQEIPRLILMNLSAEYDTVNHEILIKCVHKRLGIRDTALQWI